MHISNTMVLNYVVFNQCLSLHHPSRQGRGGNFFNPVISRVFQLSSSSFPKWNMGGHPRHKRSSVSALSVDKVSKCWPVSLGGISTKITSAQRIKLKFILQNLLLQDTGDSMYLWNISIVCLKLFNMQFDIFLLRLDKKISLLNICTMSIYFQITISWDTFRRSPFESSFCYQIKYTCISKSI